MVDPVETLFVDDGDEHLVVRGLLQGGDDGFERVALTGKVGTTDDGQVSLLQCA